MEDHWLRNKSWGSSYGEVYNFFHTQVFFFLQKWRFYFLITYNGKYFWGDFRFLNFSGLTLHNTVLINAKKLLHFHPSKGSN